MNNLLPPPTTEHPEPLYYVGIGASAGGLEALDTFFSHMPADSGMAFIVIQHLSPDYKSLMVELLSKRTVMPVQRAEEGMRVVPNTVYLIPPRKLLSIFHGKLILRDLDPGRGVNLPIDVFLRSLAEDQSEKAIGIILSGTGSDGVRGIRSIKEVGGMIMVQSEESAKFDGMPRAAIATGLADMILAPEAMPEKLLSFVRRPLISPGERPQALLSDEDGLTRIFALLREKAKVDFTFYKPNTVLRRIERRMTVNQSQDLRDYVRLLESRPGEITTLYRDLLIGVTSFFRDRQVFNELAENHLPLLLSQIESSEVRFWVAGCSTGEEAYSLAMIARECQERIQRLPTIKIFATDIDRDAIVYAGNGLYPESIAADLPPGFATKYFMHRGEHFQVQRTIREMVVFAQHNLIKDPPFTNIDLLSCRNLLIYLQPVLQQKVMEYFNFSLNADGLLILGTSETPGELGELFEPLHQKLKIFRSRGRKRPPTANPQFQTPQLNISQTTYSLPTRGGAILHAREEERLQERLLQLMAEDYVVLLVVVNDRLELIHLVGDSRRYLQLPSGKLTSEISRMAVKELAIPLATGLQKVFQSQAELKYTNIRLPGPDGYLTVSMRIRLLPVRKGQEALACVTIQESTRPRSEAGNVHEFDISQEAEQRIRDLEQELQFSSENLQATIEELETSNEELQATNEELLASNEELQSTNEELQSVNEELHTVNAEHHSKIMELTEMTNDLENLMSATQIATLFLDENLEVRKFTPEAEQIFRILPSDIGRPFSHLNHNLAELDLMPVVTHVEQKNQAQELEVSTDTGHWYQMRVLPYRIGVTQASGVVLIFLDIDARKQIELHLQNERAQLINLFDSINHIIYVTDMDTCKVLYANQTARKIFGGQLEGELCYRVLQGRNEPCAFCTNDIIKSIRYQPYQWEHYNPVSGAWYEVVDRVLLWPDGRDVRFEMAIDITERKRSAEALQRLTDLLNATQSLSQVGGWEWHLEKQEMFWSDEVYRIHGVAPGEFDPGSSEHIDRSLKCYAPHDRPVIQAAFERCCTIGESYDLEFDFTDYQNRQKRIRTMAQAVRVEGRIVKVLGNIMVVGQNGGVPQVELLS